MTLCALADVKAYKGITDTNQDAIITTLVTNASAIIESVCSRTFESALYAEVRNGNGAAMLYLRQGPIISVASLFVDTLAIPLALNAISYGYAFDDRKLYIRQGQRNGTWTGGARGIATSFRRGVQNIQIAYTAGYTTIPADLNMACVELVCDKLAKRERIDEKSQTLGQQQTAAYDLSDIPPRVMRVLRQYALPLIPQ